MARPYWSGQLQISLVSFGVKLFPAVETKSEIRFHQISRSTGDRVRHQKVSAGDDEPVEKDDIVKGYEYSKGQYIQIESQDLDNLKIPSRHTLEIQQFVGVDELDRSLFEKPYFVTPENESQAAAFAVVREALQQSGKLGIGKISLGGRETLMAVGAPSDAKLPGMMAYTLRYAAELRSAGEYFAGIKAVAVDEDQLSLAKELISRKTAKFDATKYRDEYEDALREFIDAKVKHLPVPQDRKPASTGKVIDLMDALRRSVGQAGEKKPVGRVSSADVQQPREQKHGLKLMKSAGKTSDKRRRSA